MMYLRGERNLTPNRPFKMLLNACLLIFSPIFAQIINRAIKAGFLQFVLPNVG